MGPITLATPHNIARGIPLSTRTQLLLRDGPCMRGGLSESSRPKLLRAVISVANTGLGSNHRSNQRLWHIGDTGHKLIRSLPSTAQSRRLVAIVNEI